QCGSGCRLSACQVLLAHRTTLVHRLSASLRAEHQTRCGVLSIISSAHRLNILRRQMRSRHKPDKSQLLKNTQPPFGADYSGGHSSQRTLTTKKLAHKKYRAAMMPMLLPRSLEQFQRQKYRSLFNPLPPQTGMMYGVSC